MLEPPFIYETTYRGSSAFIPIISGKIVSVRPVDEIHDEAVVYMARLPAHERPNPAMCEEATELPLPRADPPHPTMVAVLWRHFNPRSIWPAAALAAFAARKCFWIVRASLRNRWRSKA